MSREWTYWDVVCGACGNKGKVGIWTDDWNRWDGEWEGFDGPLRITGPNEPYARCLKCGEKKGIFAKRPHAQ
jgi:hypothetical protein